jgi:hypothetical protein
VCGCVGVWERSSKGAKTAHPTTEGGSFAFAGFVSSCADEMKLSIKSSSRSCGVAAEVERFHGIQHTQHTQHTHKSSLNESRQVTS